MNTEESTQTDEEIATRVQAGDLEQYGKLIERYESKLTRYGRKFLSDRDDITDIVQEVFINAYRNIQSFKSSMRFSPWIYRIAHNALVNALRDKKRAPGLLDFDTLLSHPVYEDPVESERERADMRVELERGLSALEPKYREVLVLHYFEELSYKDVAEVLAIPLGTVSIRMSRAREALRKQLQNHD